MARDATYRAGYVLSGIGPEKAFDALLDVRAFPEWAVGLGGARALDPDGRDTEEVRPGTTIEFVLKAAGLTHRVVTEVTAVDPPRLLGWRYVAGAEGAGAWNIERAGANSIEITLATDYHVRPAWLDRLAHRPVFRHLTEDLLKRSIRRLEARIRKQS